MSKTAMQELIEKLNYSIQNSKGDYQMHFSWIKSHCIILLEKEKEQIVNAFEVGYKSCDMDDAFEINRKLASGEQHYNQTYNQRK